MSQEMKKRTSPLLWLRGYLAVIILFFALASIEILFDPLAWMFNVEVVQKLRREIPAAKNHWQSYGIKDYDVDVKGFVPLICIIDATLSVRNNQLVAVMIRNPLEKAPVMEPLEPINWDVSFCSYKKLLVSEMFERVEQDLNRINVVEEALKVEFDPVYGFVKSYSFVTGYRHGIFNPVIADGNVWYEFSNFRPITNTIAP
jgi:hypothetical protein